MVWWDKWFKFKKANETLLSIIMDVIGGPMIKILAAAYIYPPLFFVRKSTTY